MNPSNAIPDLVDVARQSARLLAPESTARIAAFLLNACDDNAAFTNRAGETDLYYSGFGLDALLALGAAPRNPQGLRAFIQGALDTPSPSFVDSASALRCLHALDRAGCGQSGNTELRDQALRVIACHRSTDGGYNHEREGAAHGTVYAAFLAAQAHRDAGMPWPQAPGALASLESLRTPDGGYANHAGAALGSTPATAAAVVLLVHARSLARAQEACRFLALCRGPEGGYRAAPSAPLPDLLSTATALYAEALAAPLDAQPGMQSNLAFIESLWGDDSGFRGHAHDDASDVEYTFYGLLALGALAAIGGREDRKNR
jgi:prenyltransferase beta subunit